MSIAMCPMIFGVHTFVLFIIKLNFSCSLNGRIVTLPPPLPIMLTIEPRMINIFWTHYLISSKTHAVMVSVLRSTPSHKPLKYKCPSYCYIDIKHIHRIWGHISTPVSTSNLDSIKSVPNIGLPIESFVVESLPKASMLVAFGEQ